MEHNFLMVAIMYTLALLPFHFIGDWLLQGEWMATNKILNANVRTLHVTIYTLVLLLGMIFLGIIKGPIVHIPYLIGVLAMIAVPHWIIDTYKPLYWWRRNFSGDTLAQQPFNDWLKASKDSPISMIVYITTDQILHMLTIIAMLMYMFS